MYRRVIKVGGSLLTFDRLRTALPRWLHLQSEAANVLIVGGGPLVEVVRDLDRLLGLGEEAAHWLSLRAMGVSARVAAELWPEFRFVTDWSALREAIGSAHTPIVFDAEEFLRCHESRLPGTPLPHSWRVTSDSIAARLAGLLLANELVLLKSSLPERASVTYAEGASLGYVDPMFPVLSHSFPRVRLVNLRSSDFLEAELVP
jgi:aspartokinase-like uncharacterized kinase